MIVDCVSPQVSFFSSWERKTSNFVRTTNDEHHRVPCWLPGIYNKWPVLMTFCCHVIFTEILSSIFFPPFTICSFLLLVQLLQYLHSENKLSKRFPIGLEEQIKKWDADKIRRFHERWYFPANATLYIVGDIDDIPKTVNHIEVCDCSFINDMGMI